MNFRSPVTAAARQLLGMRIRTEVDHQITEVILTEVEAYAGAQDPASHAFRGPTLRNQTMFGPPGHLYVYRSYGVHWCANVVTGPVGRGGAVLLRGGIPRLGAEVMAQRRGRADHLTDGPGRLTQALGVTGDHDGADLSSGPVLLLPRLAQPRRIETSPRIGISKATDRPWRFVAVTPLS